jgi:hypothetical protein
MVTAPVVELRAPGASTGSSVVAARPCDAPARAPQPLAPLVR